MTPPNTQTAEEMEKRECSCCGRDIHQTVSYLRERFFKGPAEYDHACHRLSDFIRTLQQENQSLAEENRKMRECLGLISSGSGCPLHQCGIWAEKVLSSLSK